jgi:hypothetical protein
MERSRGRTPPDTTHGKFAQRLIVAFDRPEHGWVGLKLEWGGAAFSDAISYTPADVFTALCNALCAVLDGLDAPPVTLYAEPAEYDLHFVVDQNRGIVSCELCHWPDHRRTKNPRQHIFKAWGSPRAVVLPFWRALRSLQASMTPQEFYLAWRRDFPESALEELAKRVQALKAIDAPCRDHR